MRRFHITSPNTKGHIEAQYDTSGKLCQLCFKAINLLPAHIQWFKGYVPVLVESLSEAMRAKNLGIEEKEFETTFEDFKREYPLKRNTHLALKEWPNLTSANQYRAFESAIEYRRYCERNTWYKPMLPEKYLKTQQWLNDWKKL